MEITNCIYHGYKQKDIWIKICVFFPGYTQEEGIEGGSPRLERIP